MEALLGTLTVETVELHRRGAPYLLDAALEEESLPVDLLLCYPNKNKSDPFLPGEEIKNSLVKLLNLINFKDEDTTDESLDCGHESDHVITAKSGNNYQ